MPSPSSLPPGFRFHPTDEELILHYLRKRAASAPCPVSIIAEVDIYKFDPWDLPAKAIFGDREWYFFSPRDRKYPNGIRPNRAAASGYWKATGTDKPIQTSMGSSHIGVKKALVFYMGRPPKGMKTNWIMHEYRLTDAQSTNSYRPMKFKDSSMRLDDWVLCRIYKKSTQASLVASPPTDREQDVDSASDDVYSSSFQNFATPPPPPPPPQSSCTSAARLPRPPSISDFLDYSVVSDLFENIGDPAPVAPGPNQFLIGATHDQGDLVQQLTQQAGNAAASAAESSHKRMRRDASGYLANDASMHSTNSFTNQFDHGLGQGFLTNQSFSGQQHALLNSSLGSQ